MISLVILMMVLFIANLAYQSYSVYWQKELGDFERQVSDLKGVSNLHNIIRNIKPMVFRDGKFSGHVYFEGGDSSIKAIANEAMNDSKYAAAFEIQVVNNESGSVDVLYREFPIVEPLLDDTKIGAYGKPYVLLTGFEDVRFEYFGWPSFQDFANFNKEEESVTFEKQNWFGLYSGRDTLISPDIVKLRIKKNGEWSELKIPLSQFLRDDLYQFVGRDT